MTKSRQLQDSEQIKTEKVEAYYKDLPTEIWVAIYNLLDVKSIIKLSSTNKMLSQLMEGTRAREVSFKLIKETAAQIPARAALRAWFSEQAAVDVALHLWFKNTFKSMLATMRSQNEVAHPSHSLWLAIFNMLDMRSILQLSMVNKVLQKVFLQDDALLAYRDKEKNDRLQQLQLNINFLQNNMQPNVIHLQQDILEQDNQQTLQAIQQHLMDREEYVATIDRIFNQRYAGLFDRGMNQNPIVLRDFMQAERGDEIYQSGEKGFILKGRY